MKYFALDLEGFRGVLASIDFKNLPGLTWRGWREADAAADLKPNVDVAAPAVMARWTWEQEGGRPGDPPNTTAEPSAANTVRAGYLHVRIRVQPNAGAPGATAITRVADLILETLEAASSPSLAFRIDQIGLTQGTEPNGLWGGDLSIPYLSMRS